MRWGVTSDSNAASQHVVSTLPPSSSEVSSMISSASFAVSPPYEVHNVSETRLKATMMSGTALIARLWDGAYIALASSTPMLWAALVLSVPLVLYAAARVTQSRTFTAYFEGRANDARARQTFPSLWNTRKHWVLSSLISLWLRDGIPGDGMWKSDNARSLRDKEDKSALQKLVRMGMYPLFIQDGGLRTIEEEKGGLGPWGGWSCSLWKQSKKRAVFEIAVPRARGWEIEEEAITSAKEKERRRRDDKYIRFVFHLSQSKKLRRAARWRVTVSAQRRVRGQNGALRLTAISSKARSDDGVLWETGAKSWIRALLPFKGDRVLRIGARIDAMWGTVANWLVGTRLLTDIHVPVVRIEAPDMQYVELDKEVLLIAQESGLDTDWDETLANFELRKAYRRAELDPADFLPAEFLTVD